MRKVGKPPAPGVLRGKKSPGGLETEAVIAFYAVSANAAKSWADNFKAYKLDEVKDALYKAFDDKCAYCESPLATQPVDVEHYRPKSEVKTGKQTLRGYYWLAARWENLLPSCIDCNRSRKHDLGGPKRTQAGKANWFPLADERRRATAPSQERREKPLLLHPYYDDPEKHLTFDDEGRVQARVDARNRVSVKGEATIHVLGLHRPKLTAVRRDRMLSIRSALRAVLKAEAALAKRPDDPALQEDLRIELAELKRHTLPDAPYCGMATQFVKRSRP